VYQVSNSTALLKGHRRLLSRGRAEAGPRVSRTVLMLGLTSLFTDISSEMVVTVLPLYLVYVGGFTPLAFGVVDGLYNGATALMGLASGYVGDRLRKHKELASAGYGISAVCKLLLTLAGTAVSAIGAVVLLDRAGKGMRTAPRDAMISLTTPSNQLGMAFGVHRALDTTGAVLGPLVAFAILAIAPLAFHTIFLVSFLVALVGLAFIVLFVRPGEDAQTVEDAGVPTARPSLRAAFGLVAQSRYRALIAVGLVLSLATASDAFLFLVLQDELDLGASLFPLLFVGSSALYMVLAVPFGRVADRFGRGRMLVGGYALLLCCYLTLLSPLGGWPLLTVALGLLGAYYAATDGVLMALASSVVPEELRGSGLALLNTTNSLAKLVASIVFGALWTLWSIHGALLVFGIALVAAIAISTMVLMRTRPPAPQHG
jgi:MFS family permease